MFSETSDLIYSIPCGFYETGDSSNTISVVKVDYEEGTDILYSSDGGRSHYFYKIERFFYFMRRCLLF